MTNVESMDYTHSHPSIIASLSLVSRNFRRYHKPTIYLLLKTATIPTYHGISIAIPRYYCHATSIIIIYMTLAFIVILLCMIVR